MLFATLDKRESQISVRDTAASRAPECPLRRKLFFKVPVLRRRIFCRDESYINPRKSSSVEQAQQQTHQQSWTSDGPPAFFSTTNGISNIDINRHSPKPAMAQPRKSSLKTSKLFTSRGDEAADSPSFHRSASYCNGAFDEGVAGDASDADKDSRKSSDGSASESPVLGPDEPRRKSVVTFAHTAQVIQITSSDGK